MRSALRRKADPKQDVESRISRGAFSRPHYAYGIWRAACEAKQLGISGITAVEFGVAGGNGLIGMEEAAEAVSTELGIAIEILGFDTGSGMPEAADYRDMPHIWRPGFFAMDVAALKSRLTKAQLVLGNVSQTVTNHVFDVAAPVGFVSFDLDYYSSTKEAFKIFRNPAETRLPRVFCYMDDTIGDHWETHSPFAGELLAIQEFNSESEARKIAHVNGLKHKLLGQQCWHDAIYVHHDFAHPLYCRYVYPSSNWQLPLTPAN
jgi:hypothetical protein